MKKGISARGRSTNATAILYRQVSMQPIPCCRRTSFRVQLGSKLEKRPPTYLCEGRHSNPIKTSSQTTLLCGRAATKQAWLTPIFRLTKLFMPPLTRRAELTTDHGIRLVSVRESADSDTGVQNGTSSGNARCASMPGHAQRQDMPMNCGRTY